MSQKLLSEISEVSSIQELEDIRIKLLGKKGKITSQMQGLHNLSIEKRKEEGKRLNILKTQIDLAIREKKENLKKEILEQSLLKEKIDITLPHRSNQLGKIHPLSVIMHQIINIFFDLGFDYVDGPEIEDEYYNFEALNIPVNHPARQETDTFFMKSSKDKKRVLRTHTSPVQIRTMLEKKNPPIKIIAPGRVFRCDSDITHTPNFHQIEGLYVDKKVTMVDLKSCLINFIHKFFGKNTSIRFRPSFFPFTEPSAEVDIARDIGKSKEPKSDWLEILGCGMVHPQVLRNCNIDPDIYQGFAFGMGFERMTMLKYSIQDLRAFYNSDLRWLSHYGLNLSQYLREVSK